MTNTAWTPSRPAPLSASRPAPAELAGHLPRPDLPSWFGAATTVLYAGCTLTAVGILLLPALATLVNVPPGVGAVGWLLLGVTASAVTFGVGGWCFVAAHSRRVDPTTPHLHPVWFLAAWLIPVVNIVLPHRMFGDLWASARWQRFGRRPPHSPLAPRPWVMTVWALAWGLDLALFGLGVVIGLAPWMVWTHLALTAAAIALLGGIVHAIGRELGDPGPLR